jgi:arylsulfatase A-like enzyme
MTNLDIFPTLVAAAGIKPKQAERFDGRDLWSALKEDRISQREDLFFAIGERGVWGHAVLHGQWKLITQQSQGSVAQSIADGPEEVLLFHIEDDPYEKMNVADQHPELVAALKTRLAEWRALHPQGDISASSKPHPGYIAPKDWATCAIA